MIADTGLLVALERNQRGAWARFRVALDRYGPVLVPATVLAQAWRGCDGRQHHLAVAMASAQTAPLDEPTAHSVGILLARHGRSGVVDGHVASLAAANPARPVATSDRVDLEALGVARERILDI